LSDEMQRRARVIRALFICEVASHALCAIMGVIHNAQGA
jgi:hypothetical protein